MTPNKLLTLLFVFFLFNEGMSQQDPALLGDLIYTRAKRANATFHFHPDRTYGTLDVITNVEGAAFYIGTHYVDKTPISKLKLPAKKYNYKIVLKGYDDIVGEITINPEKKNELNLYLSFKKGLPVVKTVPFGVKVSIGDVALGKTSKEGLMLGPMESGTYILTLEKQDYITEERTLKVVDGKKTGLFIYMNKTYGSLKIESDKERDYVYVNKIYFGRSPITVHNLRPGNNIVKVEREKHRPWSQTVLVNPGETRRIRAILKRDRSYRNMGPYGKIKGSWGDDDGDAIQNKNDKCPDDPEDIDGFQDKDGCPDMDNDFDGISDIKEMDNKYRDMPEDFDGFEDKDGRPDTDNDKDYVPDTTDLCPFDPEDRDGHEDLDGCPDMDNDQDNIPDSTDLAPNDPEDIDGFQDKDGAPDLDNDNDGIKDFMDRCPKSSEIFNNFQDDDGCPDNRVPQPKMGRIYQVLYTLEEPFPEVVFASLDSAYNAMVVYPKVRLLIKVHSDGKGRKRKKLRETRKKAEIIQRYFSYRGAVKAGRYQVKGVGGTDPIASNVSERGRKKNTRVEIRRLK